MFYFLILRPAVSVIYVMPLTMRKLLKTEFYESRITRWCLVQCCTPTLLGLRHRLNVMIDDRLYIDRWSMYRTLLCLSLIWY